MNLFKVIFVLVCLLASYSANAGLVFSLTYEATIKAYDENNLPAASDPFGLHDLTMITEYNFDLEEMSDDYQLDPTPPEQWSNTTWYGTSGRARVIDGSNNAIIDESFAGSSVRLLARNASVSSLGDFLVFYLAPINLTGFGALERLNTPALHLEYDDENFFAGFGRVSLSDINFDFTNSDIREPSFANGSVDQPTGSNTIQRYRLENGSIMFTGLSASNPNDIPEPNILLLFLTLPLMHLFTRKQ